MSRKTLYLIDGSAQFYRAYFAFIRNPLINSKGENTSAAYGFALFLNKLLKDEKPDYLGVVFDRKEPTFRHAMYKEYKATRERMPDEMREQFPRILELIKAFDVPVIECPFHDAEGKYAYEADDVIGALAKQGEEAGLEVYMATGDKDYMQLITEHVKMYSTRPGKDREIFDVAYVKEEYGLTPAQIIDYLALMGDSSDNVPGVPKVGKKTAQALLHEYGSIEGVYENIDNITKKAVNASLRENRELADLSRELVTIVTDMPVELNLERLKAGTYDAKVLLELFQELEFNSMARALQEGEEDALPELAGYDEKKQQYHLVDTPEKLKGFATDLAEQPFWVFDTETTGLDPWRSNVIGFAFSWKKHQAYYVPMTSEAGLTEELVVSTLKPLFEDANIRKGAQNMKFDALMIAQHGIKLRGAEFDTLLAAYLVDPGARQLSLDALAEKYLSYKMISIVDLIGKKGKNQKSMTDVPLDQLNIYAGEDADITFQLAENLRDELKKVGVSYVMHEVEMPLVDVLMKMESSGVCLDTEFLAEMSKELGEQTVALQSEIYEMAGEEFNTNSPQQLGAILFDKLEIHVALGKRTPKRTATGQYSTTEAILLRYDKHPMVNKILDYRKLNKLKSTYVDALPKLISPRTGRLHTSFNQTIAATGRLSSSDPNLQNIPIRGEKGREIRKAFVPSEAERVMLSCDYSQIELRMMAHICGDDAFREAFERGEDIHASTAAAIFDEKLEDVTTDQRRKAKDVNFGIIYGISRFGLASRLGISPPEAENIIQSYFNRFPKIKKYMDDTINFARDQKYVTTLLERRRYVPEINSTNRNVREAAERVAVNSTIQGSAADLIKLAMIRIHNELIEHKLETRMILQVHDELVFDVPEGELEQVKELVVRQMEGAMELDVPLKVDAGVGANWLEAH
ncbi:MAG: DNA polymerase I [Calditrichia bacterium]